MASSFVIFSLKFCLYFVRLDVTIETTVILVE